MSGAAPKFRLIETGWEKVIRQGVDTRCTELRVVCPFIKEPTVRRLLQAGGLTRIQVLTRFRLADFCDAVSDTSALRLLLANGAKIRGVRNLHAKLYLFGDQQAVVTSANLTEKALSRNHEFGFVAADPQIIAQCRAYFDRLWPRAGKDLTLAQLDAWEAALIDARVGGARPSIVASLPDYGADAGLASSALQLPSNAGPVQAFVKFFGESHNRVSHALPVIEEVQRAGCHWACAYPKGKRPRQVSDGAVIFMGRLVEAPHDTIIFGRAVGLKHVAGRDDATPDDLVRRPWKADWPHYVRVHSAEFVAGTLREGVPLSRLMDELGSESFEITRLNRARGTGNTNPRRAYMQQAAVRLSQAGYEWLNERLEDAFARFGQLPGADLDRLDWPAESGTFLSPAK